jgi:prepilin-type N-terminal cleavage/methylation domain-containing protein
MKMPLEIVRCELLSEGDVNLPEKRGFTLLEILISLIILATGVLAIAWAFGEGIFATSDVENTERALNIAQAKMEEVKKTQFADLGDSGPTPDPDFPAFSASVNVAEGQDPMQVDVTVTWSAKGGQASLTLTTLVANC